MKAERRRGSMPSGCTPARRATVSTHAPAALSTTGASYTVPPAVTRQWLPTRSMAVTSASHTNWPPARRMPRR
jgi:hypothetical protein